MEIKENQKIKAIQLAKLLDMNDRHLRRLAEENIIIKEKGKYLFLESVHSYINYLKTVNDGDSSLKDMKLKKETEKIAKDIELKSIKISELKNELHSAEIVKKIMTVMLTNLKGKLLAVPNKIAPLVVGCDNLGDIQDIVLSSIEDVLLEVSEYSPDLFKNKNITIEDEEVEIEERGRSKRSKFKKDN